jgi:DMSO reductase anchor subunit
MNLRTSWLSREVVSWTAFLALGTATLAIGQPGSWLRWAAAAAGLVCLVCVDRVYVAMARPDRTRLDDVSGVSAGLYLGAVFAGSVWVAVALALWRIAAFRQRLAPGRHLRNGGFANAQIAHGSPIRPAAVFARWLAPVRILLSVLGLALLALGNATGVIVGAAALVLAELLDRIVFYDTLDIITPRHQMAQSLPE